jgi:hypothetical protein
MDFKERCRQANRIDIVDYLSSLGYEPAKPPRGHNYWYLSMFPDRSERTPSFKVNKNKNVWYDFGLTTFKKGGSLIDFGIRYHKCTILEFLDRLSQGKGLDQIVPRAASSIGSDREHKIEIIDAKEITSPGLISYIKSRRVSFDVAQNFCREVTYKYKDKTYYAIGFKGDRGGYELRNRYFKNSSSPKSSTFIDNGAEDITSFEGFFNFLSFMTIHGGKVPEPTNFLILNSLSFLQSALPILDKHRHKYLYWDRGTGGMRATQKALARDPSYQDQSELYAGYDDLNEWLCKIGPTQLSSLGQHPRRGIHP